VGQRGHVTAGDYNYFYGKGNENQLRTGFFVQHRIVSAVIRAEFVSDMVSYVLRGLYCNLIVLNVRAPSKEKIDDSKDGFYDELGQVFFDHFPKYHNFSTTDTKTKNNNPSRIYQLKCNLCNRAYVGQSRRAISLRHKEHLRYIRHNNPISASAMHILHNRHQFGPADETLKLLKPCNKGTKMNCWEALYMNMHYKQGLVIPEQQITDTNLLFDLATIPRDLQTTSSNSSSQPAVPYTHTTG
jgi:hypothetical protein